MGDKKRTVETEFKLRDSMSSPMRGIMGRFGELQNKFRDFRREQGLTTLGALGLGYGIGSWIEKTREANREFAGMQKGIAGVLSESLKFGKGTSELDRYNRSMVLSKDISEDLEQTSARFHVGLDDVQQTYRTLAAGAGSLGISQQRLSAITEEAVAKQVTLGGAGDQAGRLILRGLQTGRIRAVDPFSASLSNAVGNMSKLSKAARLDHIEKALRGSMQIADAMSTGIDASLNRAQMTVTALLRDATGPLFKDIAGSLDKWSKHLHQIGADGKPLVESFAGKLVTGFRELEKISGFIKEHWLAIAGVRIGTTLGQNAGKLAGMFGGGGGEGGLGAVNKGLGGMASQLGLVIGSLSAFKMGLDAYLEWADKKGDEMTLSREGARQAVTSADILKRLGEKSDTLGLNDLQTKMAQAQVSRLRHAGVLGANGIDRNALAYHLGQLPDEEKRSLQKKYGVGDKDPGKFFSYGATVNERLADAVAKQMEPLLNQIPMVAQALTKATKDDKNLMFAKGGNTVIQGNLNIQMKWEDQDPDRGFIRFQRNIEAGISRRGGQALGAEPEGM